MPVDIPALTVLDAAAWANWLVRNAATARGVWLTLAKKGHTAPTSLTYAQALDEALCQGWIDGQARRGDEQTYSQRFTPRTAKSLWSRRNVEHVARLEKEGRVTPLGRAAIDAAKADGRWESAYAGQASAELPPEFLAAVAAVPDAQVTWDSMSRSDRFAFYFRLHSLKTRAGRTRRIAAFVEMLAGGRLCLRGCGGLRWGGLWVNRVLRRRGLIFWDLLSWLLLRACGVRLCHVVLEKVFGDRHVCWGWWQVRNAVMLVVDSGVL